MSTVELIYTAGRGRAELIRIVLAACGVKFTENPISTREQLLALKPGLLFGEVPLLKVDGQKIVQVNAIVRHLARTHKLDGRDEAEKIKVDQYYEGSRDFFTVFVGIGLFIPFDEVQKRTKPSVDRYLPIYEKILKENGGTGYLVGGSLTLADLGLLEVLLILEEYFEHGVFEDYPELQKFLKTMRHESFFKNYAENIRNPKNTPEYIAVVKEIFAL